MAVGNHISILGEDEAGAAGASCPGLAVGSGLHRGRHGDNALGIVFIHHFGGLCALRGDGVGNIGCGDAVRHGGFGLLLADGTGIRLGLFLPAAVQHSIGQAAASGHHGHHQHHAQHTAQCIAALSGLLGGVGFILSIGFLGPLLLGEIGFIGFHGDSSLFFDLFTP